MESDFDGPIAAICSSAMKTVMSSLGAAPVASIRVTCVMAREGGGEEQEQTSGIAERARSAKLEQWRLNFASIDAACVPGREREALGFIDWEGCIFSQLHES